MNETAEKSFALPQIFCDKLISLCSLLNSLRITGNEDDLHKSRVGARKLESLFSSFGHLSGSEQYKQYFSRTKELIKLLGSTRELDVCISMTNDYLKLIKIQNYYLLLFLKSLEKSAAAKRKHILKSDLLNLYTGEEKKMLEFFSHEFASGRSNIYDYDVRKLFGFMIPQLYDKITDYIERFLQKPDSKSILHKMRIKSKPLRYNMEIAIEYCNMNLKNHHSQIKEFVESAGDIHDIDVLARKLEVFDRAASKVKNNYIQNKSVKIFVQYLKSRRKEKIAKLQQLLESFGKNKFRDKLIKVLDSN